MKKIKEILNEIEATDVFLIAAFTFYVAFLTAQILKMVH